MTYANADALAADLASAATPGASLVKTASGDTVETVLAKRAPIVTLAGIVGDGVTNDASAFQAAVTAAASSKIPLHLTGGLRIRINSQINLPSNLTITGDGGCTIELGANVTALKTAAGASNIRLSGFKIDGKRATYTSNGNNGIHVDWTTAAGSDIVIDTVTVKDVGGVGILGLASSGTASSGIAITNCHVENTGAHGIITQDYISRVRILGNEVYYTGMNTADRPGITASRYGTDVVVSNNIVVGSASALGTSCHGISIDLTSNVTCTGNTIRDWKGMGLELGFVECGAFSDNSIDDCNYGINLSGHETVGWQNKHCTVTGNTIRNCINGISGSIASATGAYLHEDITISGNNVYAGSVGYYLRHIRGLTLVGNKAYECSQSGAWVEDCPDHFIDGLHLLRNNLSGGLKSATIAASGSTATATVTNHGYSTNDVVTVWGASPTEYCQNAAITVIDANNFTYTLPRSGLASPAVGTILVGKAASSSHAGFRIVWLLFSSTGARGFNRVGTLCAAYNGFRDIYDVSVNGLTGILNSTVFLRDRGTSPRAENLTSALTADVKDGLAIFMKNGKKVEAWNEAGTINYRSTPLTAYSISALTNNSGGTASNTIADVPAAYSEATLANQISSLTAKINEIIAVLPTSGTAAP